MSHSSLVAAYTMLSEVSTERVVGAYSPVSTRQWQTLGASTRCRSSKTLMQYRTLPRKRVAR
eukprot:3589385-Rhodomonas_salina.4